jgi:hypothetical protein
MKPVKNVKTRAAHRRVGAVHEPWFQRESIPERFVADNGLEFHSPLFQARAMHLSSDILYCAVRQPGLKPSVERAIGKINGYRTIKQRHKNVAELEAIPKRQPIRTKARLSASPMNAAIEQLAAEVFESEEEAWKWLNSPHAMLDDKTPTQAAETLDGADRVKELLVATKWGGVV